LRSIDADGYFQLIFERLLRLPASAPNALPFNEPVE
jgi:hypothetical protein